MRQAVRPNPSRRRVSKSVTVPAPYKGWVTEENIVAGTMATALQLDNIFPDTPYVSPRRGYQEHSDTTVAAPVNTLIAFHRNDGVKKLYAAVNTTIYDVTATSPSATSITSLSTSRLQWVNFAATTSNYLFIVNGADNAISFDGTTWATPTITGLSSADFTNVCVFKGRLYFTLADSLQFGYLPTAAIAGAAAAFDLGPQFSKGGYLVAAGVWTIDGGSGQDDYICFVTSEGQVAVYSGDDPSDPANFSKVGTYDLPRPIGVRCLRQVGSDLYLITEAGIISLRESLALDLAAVTNSAITKNIQTAMNAAAQGYSSNFGWELVSHPFGKMAFLNVPISEAKLQHQLVMNSNTGAWCRFTGLNANCWAVLGNELYFGGNDGIVYRADIGSTDNGSDIIAQMRGNFDYFGARGLLKDWKMIQPVIYADGNVRPAIGLDVDFVEREPTSLIVVANSSNVKWDGFNWDAVNWPDNSVLSNRWVKVTGSRPGYAASVSVKMTINGTGSESTLRMNAFNIMYEVGDPI